MLSILYDSFRSGSALIAQTESLWARFGAARLFSPATRAGASASGSRFAARTFATLAHECAHEPLHQQKKRGDIPKQQIETEAEAVAFIVCRPIGLETGNACQNYIQLYCGVAALLMESLETVRSAASRILNGIRDDGAV